MTWYLFLYRRNFVISVFVRINFTVGWFSIFQINLQLCRVTSGTVFVTINDDEKKTLKKYCRGNVCLQKLMFILDQLFLVDIIATFSRPDMSLSTWNYVCRCLYTLQLVFTLCFRLSVCFCGLFVDLFIWTECQKLSSLKQGRIQDCPCHVPVGRCSEK